MSLDLLLAVASFCFVASMTPGPNNVMLLASAVNFGFRRTVPHMIGIVVGVGVLFLAVGAGLGFLLSAFPFLETALKIVGGAYLLYLAYRVAMTRKLSTAAMDDKPMTVTEAAIFQWVNPKAWIIGTTVMAIYTDPDHPAVTVSLVAGLFMIAAVISTVTWSGFGTILRGFLADPRRLKWFNIVAGMLLAATVIPLVT